MYDDLAYLWPLVSAPEGYAREASYWHKALREKLGAGRHSILELGVGGGNNLSHLTRDFQATAVDLSEKMLAHSKKLNPNVEHHVGDMRTVRLGGTFKAVIIHDAISYMLPKEIYRPRLRRPWRTLSLAGSSLPLPIGFGKLSGAHGLLIRPEPKMG